ncbi:MAG TPA: leucine--tRNA ligase [Gemmatimonadaceae bacterium]|nr:leucine--tRNA ligase [Gemmatimonadaceae bacterium]
MDNSATRNDPSPSSAVTYDSGAIERKWQRLWQERGTNNTDLQRAQRPFYALMMFPYPSAEGLHVGNLFAFTGNDIYGRFQRLMGHNVFEPLGYDAFGIHSENYALKVGQHPMDLIPRNIANFRRQLERAGLMIDWRYTLATTEPNYYKWTQWLFLKLFDQGLAYKKQAAVNWCPKDKTVLANEQVVGGACERCGTPVEQRLLEQWFFRISDYAPRLLENLNHIDWSETTKTAQRNWIGRSEGAEISFATSDVSGGECEIRVFTTRPDTIYGATYMVLAPEHPLVERLTQPKEKKKVDAYSEQTKKQDIITRKTSTEKTGVFIGSYAINPATGKQIPVWISDYVLMEYGTGAIMGVPGHDERDFEFATKFRLPIVRVVCGEREDVSTPLREAFVECESGTLVNSGVFDGFDVDAAKKAITEYLARNGAAKPVVHYRLHDWCISRQRYWGPPIPIIYCESCGTVPVPEKDLPVVLPFIEDFKPDDSGVSPLARHEEWYRVACPKCGKMGRRETDVSDNFLDNSWYFLRYPSVGHDDVPFEKNVTRKWLPVDSYIGGNEHAVLHLLYSRFITMVLHDAGHLEFEEPYRKFRAHGHIIREGAKMSKTQGNIVNPDEYIEEWGADAFRTYLMFLGPYEQGGDFRDRSISGTRRFLDRLFASVQSMSADAEPDHAVMRKLHQTIRKVTEDIPRLSYNTAIAAMMEYMNVLRKGERTPHRDEVVPLIPLVSPFAPHIAEELWEQAGGTGSVFDSAWPSFDPALAAEDSIELVVQVNGKVRSKIMVARDISEEAAMVAALADPTVARFVAGAPKKIIFVPGRLLNIVA